MTDEVSSLQILLLGPAEIRWKGKPLVIQRRIPRALLLFLAAQNGPVGREDLLPLFWEDSPEESARSRLREALHRLHRALPDAHILQVERDLVKLDFQRVYVDLHHVERIMETAAPKAWEIPVDEPLPPPLAQTLQDALRLWRGERFLAGTKLPSSTSLDEWLARMTQHTDLLRLALLERLARHAHANRDLPQAIRLARLMVEQDESNSDLHAYLIDLLIEADRLDDARRQFERARRILKDIHTTLSPQLDAVYHKLNHLSSARRLPRPQWNVRQSLATPFVGRQLALAQLERMWRTGGVVFLLGESGLGKTRLLQEFAARLDPPARVALANCRPCEDQLPFQPLVDIIRRYVNLETLRQVPAQWMSPLLPLLPDLSIARPDIRLLGQALPDAGRALIFEAMRQLTLPVCRTGKLLWVLDDAQWADTSTLDAAAYIIERPPFDHNQLVVFVGRIEEMSPQFKAFMSALQTTRHAMSIYLTRLDPLEVATLANSVLGRMPSPQFTERLARDTGGNPLFILETLQALLAQNPQPDLTRPIETPLAQNVETLLRARLGALSPLAASILETAAILGAVFDPGLVQLIVSCTPTEMRAGLAELETKALIEPVVSSSKEISYRFLHDKIREALLGAMNPLHARQLHEKAGRALETVLGEQTERQAAVLAQHFESAGLLQAAFDYWLEAGVHARQVFSPQEALYAYKRAEDLARQLGPTLPDDSIHRLYAAWSRLLFERDSAAPLEALGQAWLEWGRQRSSPTLIGAALSRLSDADFVRGDYAAALDHINQAIPYLLRGNHLLERMEAYNRQGLYLYMLGRWGEVQAAFQNVLLADTDCLHPELLPARATADYHLALLYNLTGQPAIARQHAERMLDAYRASGDLHGQSTAYGILSFIHYFQGDYLQASADNQLGLELAERLQAWRMLGYIHAYRAMIELALGHMDACLNHAEQAIELGARHGHEEIATVGHRVMGDVCLWLNKPAQAAEYYGRALRVSRGGFLAADPMFRLGLALCLSGEMDAGQAHLHQAMAMAEQAGLELVLGLARLFQARVNLLRGDRAEAHRLACRVIEDASQRQIAPFRLLAANLLGEIALADADFPAPLQLLQEHAAEAARAKDLWMELETQILIAQLQRRSTEAGESPRQRILQLLDQLAADATRQPFADWFAAYRQTVIQRLEPAAPTQNP